jgi:hypothetical protein
VSLLAAICIVVTVLVVQSQVPSSNADSWLSYRDETHGLSFRYPPDVRPVVASAGELRGLSGWVRRVDLVPMGATSDTLPILTVSVFVCDDPHLNPRVPCVDEGWFKGICDRFQRFRLGNAVALQCVSYSRAACHWEAIVLRETGSVRVSAPAMNTHANRNATERAQCADAVVKGVKRSPLKEILASFVLR